ncbi:hypothetical protein TD95_001436 [Thielaviopsis punctulata]|uniref:NADH-ubiquinone oxidoreductase 9.5 kDa subunit n=1 Tax=Thielaviopsis punctulata TaxID=72032 RepID=A0A0F4ZBD2_9PEZI|nr:hypothetical protein TD95_001436 [Thielaviopsis punctulata]
MSTPRFFAAPLPFLRWSMRERPAYFWSIVLGVAGPVGMATIPPIRHALGDVDAPPLPVMYPIPTGPRKKPHGFEDE